MRHVYPKGLLSKSDHAAICALAFPDTHNVSSSSGGGGVASGSGGAGSGSSAPGAGTTTTTTYETSFCFRFRVNVGEHVDRDQVFWLPVCRNRRGGTETDENRDESDTHNQVAVYLNNQSH